LCSQYITIGSRHKPTVITLHHCRVKPKTDSDVLPMSYCRFLTRTGSDSWHHCRFKPSLNYWLGRATYHYRFWVSTGSEETSLSVVRIQAVMAPAVKPKSGVVFWKRGNICLYKFCLYPKARFVHVR
jgi:hypothetical protein